MLWCYASFTSYEPRKIQEGSQVTVVTLVTRVTDGVPEFLREKAMLRCYASFTSYGPRKIREGSQVTVVTLLTRVTDGVPEVLREKAMFRCYASYAVTWGHITHFTSHYCNNAIKVLKKRSSIHRPRSPLQIIQALLHCNNCTVTIILQKLHCNN